MARTQVYVQTTSGVTATYPLDHQNAPQQTGFQVALTGSGDITYTVQHTYNNVLAGSAATFFDHPTASGKTTSAEGAYINVPINAIRLNVAATSGSISARFAIAQAGPAV